MKMSIHIREPENYVRFRREDVESLGEDALEMLRTLASGELPLPLFYDWMSQCSYDFLVSEAPYIWPTAWALRRALENVASLVFPYEDRKGIHRVVGWTNRDESSHMALRKALGEYWQVWKGSHSSHEEVTLSNPLSVLVDTLAYDWATGELLKNLCEPNTPPHYTVRSVQKIVEIVDCGGTGPLFSVSGLRRFRAPPIGAMVYCPPDGPLMLAHGRRPLKPASTWECARVTEVRYDLTKLEELWREDSCYSPAEVYRACLAGYSTSPEPLDEHTASSFGYPQLGQIYTLKE